MPGFLASQTTSFIGRAGEIAELKRLLDDGARLITLLGPPGVGKTRLAHQFARSESSGAWICDLTDVEDGDGICAALAATLGVSPTSEGDAAAHLGAALAGRGPVLLVLDNFEQLVFAAADTVGVWLAAAPEAQFLVTSRERLRLPGEVSFDLDPLGLPAPGEPDPSCDAMRLFIDRARAARAGWAPSGTDLGSIAELVRQLDGLPLAIELAAARARVLGPAQLLEKLTERFGLLRDRGSGGRFSALHGALEWSWDMLGAWERDALAQCSVFRGGFGIDAAEAVIDLGAHESAPAVLDAVQALCDRSLVHSHDARDLPGERRFGLYVSVREFAAERLSPTARRAAEARHAAHYLGCARARTDRTEYARLALEAENLASIVHRGIAAATREGAEQALLAVLALEPVHMTRGPQRQRLVMLDAAVVAADDKELDPALRARARIARAAARHRVGDSEAARLDLARAASLAPGDRELAAIDAELGTIEYETGTRDAARSAFERAREAASQTGDVALLGRALAGLGMTWRSHPERARQHFEAALRALRGSDHLRLEADVIAGLGDVDSRAGQLRSARSRYEKALRVYQQIRDAHGQGLMQVNLAALDQEEGALEQASRRYEAGVQLLEANGDAIARSLHVMYQGTCFHERGLLADARECYEEALELFRRAGSQLHESQVLGHLAVIDASEDRIAEATRALDDAQPKVAQANTATNMAALTLQRGHLDLAHGRRAAAQGDLDGARAHWKSAAARLEIARRAQDTLGFTLADRSQDLRGAIRLLAAAVGDTPPWENGQSGRRAEGMEAAAPEPDHALVVATTGRWFRPPGGERVDIRRRGAIRRLLGALADLHASDPGAAYDREQLLEIGWPGEIVHPEAGARRVHTALWTLRKLGLRDVLVSRDDGYLLDPRVAVVRLDEQC